MANSKAVERFSQLGQAQSMQDSFLRKMRDNAMLKCKERQPASAVAVAPAKTLAAPVQNGVEHQSEAEIAASAKKPHEDLEEGELSDPDPTEL